MTMGTRWVASTTSVHITSVGTEMLSFDSSLMNVYRQAMMSFPTSSPSDAILFGKNIRYQPFVLLTLTEDQRFAVDRAKKYALEQSIQNALSKQAAQLHQQDLNTIKRNQALILLSRIYVGSISFEVGEDDIRKTFSPFGPIKSVALSWDSTLQKHKGFAFIEFEVGRPSNAPQTGNLEAELRADESTRYRVYVASVHPELTESDIQTVFEAFGKVKSCTLYPDPKSPGRHRGFGYIEFESEEAVIAAVSSMNCFDLAGQQLRVGRAIIPKDSPLPFEAATAKPNSTSAAATQASVSAVALAAASISAQVMSMSAEEASAAAAVPDGTAATSRRSNQSSGFGEPPAVVANLPPPGVFIPTVVGPANVSTTEPLRAEEVVSATTTSMWDDDDDSLMPSAPADAEAVTFDDNPPSESSSFSPGSLSRVMLLENMVSVDEVDDDLKTEVAEECANYGDVLQVHVHVIGDTDVRIFVQFDRSDAARAACDALNQRFFAGRIVRAKLFDEERFQLHQFDD
ncbi:poly(U)-binding-splicing factor PUF60 [Paragonimus westermani]|uniref:Poly(U)-binding-splicing factor PUF60 n=1 Tax=Paragonimus westermani TaxID=34504 RepID=A0A5J4NZZ7_9TREM|nr:poly(U)-binding-splicing factor PUF60 [Paragonimus westermani]